MIPVLICLFLIVIWIYYQRSKSDQAIKKESDAFWSREREANLSRKKDLTSLDYITIPFENLPFSENNSEEILHVQNQLNKLKDQKIANLTGLSNTDLKITYGAANLTLLTTYDHNYTLLVRYLNQWGQLLLKSDKTHEARTVLAYAISCGSDISQTYLSLAAIYLDSGDYEALFELQEKAHNLTSPLKESLIQKLDAICEKASRDQE